MLLSLTLPNLKHYPLQFLLQLLGLATGIAVVVAIDLANQSAIDRFFYASEMLQDPASHRLVHASGTVDDAVLQFLRIEAGVYAASPVIEVDVRWLTEQGWRDAILIAADGLSQSRLYDGDTGISGSNDSMNLITTEDAILLPVTSTSLLPGKVTLEYKGKTLRFTPIGYLRDVNGQLLSDTGDLLMTDLLTARRLLQLNGRSSHIGLRLPDGYSVRQLESRLKRRFPGVELLDLGTEKQSRKEMRAAFHLNLSALSYLALIVALFLIYNASSFSVLRRQQEISTLRTLGYRRRDIRRLLLSEALLLAILASTLGIMLGFFLANGLSSAVRQSVSDLYQVSALLPKAGDSVLILKAVLLGVGATLLATAIPVQQATRYSVIEQSLALENEARFQRRFLRFAWIGLGLLLASITLALAPSESLLVAYLVIVMLLTGVALMVPVMLLTTCRLLQQYLAKHLSIVSLLVLQGIRYSPSRLGIAAAAFVIALSVVTGIGTMIGSFRQTVENWLDGYLQSDIYIALDSTQQNGAAVTELLRLLQQREEIAAISLARWTTVRVKGQPVSLMALQTDDAGYSAFQLKRGNRESADLFFTADSLLVSESYAYRYGLKDNDRIEVETPSGLHSFAIAAIHHDYRSTNGQLVLHRDTYRRYWQDEGIDGISLRLVETVRMEPLVRFLEGQPLIKQQGRIRPAAKLKAISLAIFDRTFVVTSILRTLAMIVAGLGLFLALMAILLEQKKRLAGFRVLGFTRRQMLNLMIQKSVLLGLFSGILAIPLGYSLSWCLVALVNLRSFGWSMPVIFSAESASLSLATAILTALIASIWPAIRLYQQPLTVALHHE